MEIHGPGPLGAHAFLHRINSSGVKRYILDI